VGLPAEPVLVKDNVVHESKGAGIGVRNEHAGETRGFVMDDTYALIVGNTVFGNTLQGIGCQGSAYGTSHCTIVGNDAFWNHQVGIGLAEGAAGYVLNNDVVCNTQAGISTVRSRGVTLLNNIAYFNVMAGIVDPGTGHDFNLLSGNNGQGAACATGPGAERCRNAQCGLGQGSTGARENDLFDDPLFGDAPRHDFTLRDGSPVIDDGTDISAYYPGWPTAGRGPDRGSHERQ